MSELKRVAVALSMYNGAKYIRKQLESIYRQTFKPDEVIIVDDNSSDEGVSIVMDFIEKHKLNTWKVYSNKKNKGYPNNIYYTISLCESEFIFLSDQDDYWMNTKIETMLKIFYEDPELLLLSSEADYIYNTNIQKHGNNNGKLTLNKVDKILNKKNYLGMCMCIKKELLQYIDDEIIDKKIPHDILLDLITSDLRKSKHINLVLARHIIHHDNYSISEVNINDRFNYRHKLQDINAVLNYLNELKTIDIYLSDNINNIVKKKYKMVSLREEHFRKKEIFNLICLFLLSPFYYSYKSLISDCICVFSCSSTKLERENNE